MASPMPPQTLSIKRKRNEAPVDALRFDHANTIKRQRSSQNFTYRRLARPGDKLVLPETPRTPTGERRFHLAPAGAGAKRVFVEARAKSEATTTAATSQSLQAASESLPPVAKTPPRKRPGAGTALRPTQPKATAQSPSEADVRTLEALSAEISRVDNLTIPLPLSPSKHKPRAPAKRYAERHPEKFDTPSSHSRIDGGEDGDAMDIDDPNEYIIETYIREPLDPNAPVDTSLTTGLLVLSADDDDWWDADSAESDKEFDTDDEDSNAEEYYANDYPEDELSEDDEFGRNVYQKKYRHGSDDEEYVGDESDEEGMLGSGDEDDKHYKMTVPGVKRGGYWGAVEQ